MERDGGGLTKTAMFGYGRPECTEETGGQSKSQAEDMDMHILVAEQENILPHYRVLMIPLKYFQHYHQAHILSIQLLSLLLAADYGGL